jgi:hypothetical protein
MRATQSITIETILADRNPAEALQHGIDHRDRKQIMPPNEGQLACNSTSEKGDVEDAGVVRCDQ